MEGISGVATAEDVVKGHSEYSEAQTNMLADVNAAIEGAVEADAKAVLVNDSHATMRNIIPERLHPQAELIRGNTKPRSQIQGLSNDHDIAMFIGYHAKAGTTNALLNHSYYTNEIIELRVNGDEVGEIGCNARYARSLGVPVGLVTGDDLAMREAADEIQGVNTVIVKESIDRFSARMYPRENTREQITEMARQTVEDARRGSFTQTQPEEPTTIEIDWATTNQARFAARFGFIKRVGGRTTRVKADSYPETYTRFVSMMRAGAAGTDEHYG